MKTRACNYCFSLQGGNVFADFNIDNNQCLYLVRISFDGYGCCDVSATKGNPDQVQLFSACQICRYFPRRSAQ